MLEWNVYNFDYRTHKIDTFNIFTHGGFIEDYKKAIKKYKTKSEFEEEIEHNVMYWFWSKSEYEVIISPWISRGDDVKIDVYDQLKLNWDTFVDYLWNNKRVLTND